MVFSSFVFLFRFLPVVLFSYYLLPDYFRNFWLLISSLLFYAWGEPKYVVLLIISIIINYVFGIVISFYKEQKHKKAARIVMTSAVCANILLLCIFKYTSMLVQLFENITSQDIDFVGIMLPAGISFYTFQSMSYIIDIYRGDVKAQRNIISFGMYIAMFPQLLAGPVVRYKTIEPQITRIIEKESFSERGWKRCKKAWKLHGNMDLERIIENLSYGIGRLIIGLSKKVILANNVGLIWMTVSEMESAGISAVTAWIGIIAFSFQIYFDFSGYSDMAIGLAAMFGFHLEENFNYPYISQSITEFWRRWHISIGSWFREYVYIPLGGNRTGMVRHIFNILLVWMLTGLWHGTSYNFLLWGLYFGVILLLEKYLFLKGLKKLPSICRYIYSSILILFGWVIFELDNISEVTKYFKSMFGANGWILSSDRTLYLLYTNLLFFLILFLASTPLPAILWSKMKRSLMKTGKRIYIYTLIRNMIYVLLLIISIAYLVEESYNPFLYLKF